MAVWTLFSTNETQPKLSMQSRSWRCIGSMPIPCTQSETSREMAVQIHIEAREFTDPRSRASQGAPLGMKPDRVAVELNRNIVPREQWAETQLCGGDRLEIVPLVAGGPPLLPAYQELPE